MDILEKSVETCIRQINVVASALVGSDTLENISLSCIAALLNRLEIALVIPGDMNGFFLYFIRI